MTDVYLTAAGAYLPGEPVTLNPESGLARRILAANGIRTRHYAAPDELNEQLAAEAIERALKERGLGPEQIGLLATGTTHPDLRVPGFASMVHGRLGGAPMEILSAGGVCASSMTALAAAERALRTGAHDTAVVVGSELAGRHLAGGAGPSSKRLDEEFLRWTLSDGAGAVVLETRPRPDGLSLRLDWTHLVSYAHEHPACMYEQDGRLRQDVSLLPKVFAQGVEVFNERVKPDEIDHLLCHYSAEKFRADLV
ncbi:MAG: 3-oxoacyl-[acyl-carrier-protein] synthase III C-terminal domain-containing protein, partial [Dehalococcoidia bacterium]